MAGCLIVDKLKIIWVTTLMNGFQRLQYERFLTHHCYCGRGAMEALRNLEVEAIRGNLDAQLRCYGLGRY